MSSITLNSKEKCMSAEFDLVGHSEIEAYSYFLEKIIEQDLVSDNFFFLYNGREIRSAIRIRNLIFPYLLRMVEHHLSAFIGRPIQNFIFRVEDTRNGNMLKVEGINRNNPPNRILVNSAMLFIYNRFFKPKAKEFDLLNYVSSING